MVSSLVSCCGTPKNRCSWLMRTVCRRCARRANLPFPWSRPPSQFRARASRHWAQRQRIGGRFLSHERAISTGRHLSAPLPSSKRQATRAFAAGISRVTAEYKVYQRVMKSLAERIGVWRWEFASSDAEPNRSPGFTAPVQRCSTVRTETPRKRGMHGRPFLSCRWGLLGPAQGAAFPPRKERIFSHRLSCSRCRS
jgi:hypothetical protein